MLTFQPLRPTHSQRFSVRSIAIYVRDHKHRELPVSDRSVEAYYDGFVLTQARRGEDEAKRLVLDVPYGRAPRATRIAGRKARVYELGPEPEPGDIDPRDPGVVVWCDAEMFFLIASDELSSEALIRIARSLY